MTEAEHPNGRGDDPRLPAQLADECRAIADVAGALSESTFSSPTNCPPWTVKELIVHIAGTIWLPQWMPSSDAPVSAVGYYQRGERETDEYRARSAQAAQGAAAAFATGADAVAALRSRAGKWEAELDGDLSEVVRLGNGVVISKGDYIVTRVVSVAIHGIDLAISLDRPWFVTGAAHELLVQILEELVGAPASALGWSEEELILWGTGRILIPNEAQSNPAVNASLPVIS